MEDKKKRFRRTNANIDKDIMAATKDLIEEIGFSNITITGVMQKAKIEPNVFYNRFDNIDELLNTYARGYDHWFIDVCSNMGEGADMKQQYNTIVYSLINALFDDKGMQQLLIWEISGNSDTAKQIAQERDKSSLELAIYFENKFKVDNLSIRVFTSLLVSGIYYLILHKDISTFCGIDFTGEKGKQQILDCIQTVVDKICVFEGQALDPQVLDVARKLKLKGVDAQIIMECTSISAEELAWL